MSGIRVIALSGGVGGAKLLRGLYRVLPPRTLAAVINTGDDFEHLGLHISPDIDTALYTLSDLAHPEQGWGRREETWNFMAALEAIGGETWFRLGDADLALHIERTRRLRAGETLTAITRHVAQTFGIAAEILPMSDSPVATRVMTDEGELAFQDYFVRRRCVPRLTGLRFVGAENAKLSDAARDAFASSSLEAIVIAPSNPWLSIDPLLAIGELRHALEIARVPIIAATPIVAGKAVKGPAAKIMSELGIEVSPLSIANHYGDLLDGFVLDSRDAAVSDRFRVPVEITDTLMVRPEDSDRVARAALAFVPLDRWHTARLNAENGARKRKMREMAMDSENYRDLFDQKKAFASLATLMPDGSPQVTPVWFDRKDGRFRVNTAKGRVKARNMKQGSPVALSIMDPDNAYRYVQVRGTVSRVTQEGADAHIDTLAKKYLGQDKYPFRQPGEERIMYEITPTSFSGMG